MARPDQRPERGSEPGAGFAVPFVARPASLGGPVLALWTGAYCVGLCLAVGLALAAGAGGAAPGALLAAGLAVTVAVAAPVRGGRALLAVNGSMLLALAGTLLAAWPF